VRQDRSSPDALLGDTVVVMPGEPSYIELGVPDVDAARQFYGSLLGWATSGLGTGGEVQTPTLPIGIHGGDPEAQFELFFTVDDLDVSIAQVNELGGSVLGDAHDSDDFGRWVECRDDQGVRFGLRQPR
jgi:predicted enzyme related to lactoylglutathione lyase